MALTLTVAQLSEAVRLTVSGSPAPPYLAIVTRQLSAATEIIEGYADDAPDNVKNEAAIMLVGYSTGQAADAKRLLSKRSPRAAVALASEPAARQGGLMEEQCGTCHAFEGRTL